MNLRAVVNGLTTAVNPNELLTVQVSTGPSENDDGSQSPTYASPIQVWGQVQSLTYTDLTQIDGLNIQGIRRAVYLNGEVDGLVRSENKGGDLIQRPDGTVWLVAHVLEYWPDWTKAVITLQDDTALPSPTPGTGTSATATPIGAGLVRYAEASSQAILQLDPSAPNPRTQLVMTIDPTQTINNLRGSFAGITMWDGTLLHTPDVNDVLGVRIAMNVTAMQSGGSLRCEAQIAGTSAILDTKTEDLADQANVTERIAFEMTLFSGTSFLANGVQFYLTPIDSPCNVQNETILITPISSGP